MVLRRNRLLILLMVTAMIGGAYYYYKFLAPENAENGLTIYGNVDIRQVDLAFFATGRVDRLLVEEGEQVKEGQLLAQMDASRCQAALARAKARLKALEKELAIKESGSRSQDVKEAQAALAAAEARLEGAGIKLLWPHYWPMAVIGMFCLILTGFMFRRRLS